MALEPEEQDPLQNPDDAVIEDTDVLPDASAEEEPINDGADISDDVDDEKQKLKEQNERLRKSNQQLHARLQKGSAKPKTQAAPTSQPTRSADFDIEEVVDLRVSGYSKEEIDHVKAFARGRGIKSLSEAVKDPFITAGIKAQRESKKREDATPPSSGRHAPTRSGEKKFADMSEDERRARFEKLKSKRRK